jgi:hypothetical protein
MGKWDGPWKPCIGMNKDGKCRAGKNHLLHRKHWIGGWYAQVPLSSSEKAKQPSRRARAVAKPKQKKKWWQ